MSDVTPDQATTHFGFKEVPVAEKSKRVAEVFDSVASRYDLMNDVMSGGLHRLWKRFAIELAAVRPGQRVLDLASGTGDLAAALAQRVGENGCVVASDINASMLAVGRGRLADKGIVGNVRYALADAEKLPFADGAFDCITMAFGLRNVTRKQIALDSAYRALRPGGRMVVLEFSQLTAKWAEPVYDTYSFKILPMMGRLIARDAESYRYLAESIRQHPNQETLKAMMRQAGFERCEYHNLCMGVVAIHRGFKF